MTVVYDKKKTFYVSQFGLPMYIFYVAKCTGKFTGRIFKTKGIRKFYVAAKQKKCVIIKCFPFHFS